MQQPGVNEWIVRCAQRLRDQWRTVDPGVLEGVAVDLLREPQLRVMRTCGETPWLSRSTPSKHRHHHAGRDCSWRGC